MNVRIAIDCMGGDHGLSTTLPAAVRFLAVEPEAHLLLVGRQDEIDHCLNRLGLKFPPVAADGAGEGSESASRVTRVQAAEVVAMDDPPAQALRGKRDSSMRRAIELVRDGQADACVSAGNTGALMAISRFVLKMLEGIDRPAIAAPVPNARGGQTLMLDLGANVDCDPEHLLQFAVMGSALVSALGGPDRPSVGLLNIGEESIKGNETVKQAAELLRASTLNFYGNVEGDDIYKGTVDVVVCDGFVGNVALKTSEGLAKMLAGFIREEFGRNAITRLMALVSMPVLQRLRRRVDPGRYNGASLIGLRGVVIKSHGASDAIAFEHALRRAHDSARNRLLERIGQAMPRVVH